VYKSEHTTVRIISFADVEDIYSVTQHPQEPLALCIPEGRIFHGRGKFYMGDRKYLIATIIPRCIYANRNEQDKRSL
jgi:hypothetical protein